MPPLPAMLAYFLVGYAAVTVAFYVMASLGIRVAGFVARVLAAYMALMLVSFFGVWASIGLHLVGQGGNGQHTAGRAFKWAMLLVTGILFTIEDPDGYLDSTRPAIFIGNHQTELDVLMLGTIFPKHCSVTAKSSLKHMPVLGWFMRASGTIFIDRKNAKDARQAMAGAANEIRLRQQSVYIFPEGTRSYSIEPELLPFKKGAFHLAIQAGVPIVPVVVANYSHILCPKQLVFKSGRIPCKVLKPIPTEGLTTADVDELAQTTREMMMQELVSLTARARGKPVPVDAVAAQEEVVKATGAQVRADM